MLLLVWGLGVFNLALKWSQVFPQSVGRKRLLSQCQDRNTESLKAVFPVLVFKFFLVCLYWDYFKALESA